jgi:outer membrane usher protein FimD/PapC
VAVVVSHFDTDQRKPWLIHARQAAGEPLPFGYEIEDNLPRLTLVGIKVADHHSPPIRGHHFPIAFQLRGAVILQAPGLEGARVNGQKYRTTNGKGIVLYDNLTPLYQSG